MIDPYQQRTNLITIDQNHCRIIVPRGTKRPPHAISDQLLRIMRRDVVPKMQERLENLLDDSNAVYRIRNLNLNFWVDTYRMSDLEIANLWGSLIAAALVRAIRLGTTEQVIRFESPIDFVSSFIADLLDNRAWQYWYYEEFKNLRSLPSPKIALQLLAVRPDWIRPVFDHLTPTGHADRLIAAWSRDDITHIKQALNISSPQTAFTTNISPTDLQQLVGVMHQTALVPSNDPVQQARNWLRLWLAVSRQNPNLASQNFGALIQVLIDISAFIRSKPDLAPLLKMQTGLYTKLVEQLEQQGFASTLEWLLPVTSSEKGRSQLAAITEALQSDKSLSSRPSQAALSSDVGSVFLLLPALVESGLWEQWLAEHDEATARNFLFIVALKALGKERAPLNLSDQMLARLAGLPNPPIADNRLQLHADTPLPDWVDGIPSIAARWNGEMDSFEVEIDDSYVVYTDACWLFAGDRNKLERRASFTNVTASTQAHRERIQNEFAYFQLGQQLGYPWLTSTLDAALSTVCSLVTRRTAQSIPRFENSSPIYLANQFLAQPARLQSTNLEWRIILSGGPLAPVLRLANLPEMLNVPWLSQAVTLSLASSWEA